jgi:carbamoyl-phosphate synthase large subunit
MTDAELADRTYVEPLTLESARQVIARGTPRRGAPDRRRPDGLNLVARASPTPAVLEAYGVRADRCRAERHPVARTGSCSRGDDRDRA